MFTQNIIVFYWISMNWVLLSPFERTGSIKRVCTASCSTEQSIIGQLECDKGNNDGFSPDRKMENFERKNAHGITCQYDTCDEAEFGTLLPQYYPSNGLSN